MEKNEEGTYLESAQYYAKTADLIVPDRKHILETISKLTALSSSAVPNMADLGGGLGDVTAEIWQYTEFTVKNCMGLKGKTTARG